MSGDMNSHSFGVRYEVHWVDLIFQKASSFDLPNKDFPIKIAKKLRNPE